MCLRLFTGTGLPLTIPTLKVCNFLVNFEKPPFVGNVSAETKRMIFVFGIGEDFVYG